MKNKAAQASRTFFLDFLWCSLLIFDKELGEYSFQGVDK